MKFKKNVITLIASITLVATGSIAITFDHPKTVKAFNIGFKKGIPNQFKHSWTGKTINSNVGYSNGYSANFIIKNGSQYKFITNYWNQDGQNVDKKSNVNNLKLKYQLKVSKKQYLLATKVTDRKHLILVKFTGKKTMRFSFAEVNKQGKLYRTSDHFSMTAATKSNVTESVNRDLRDISSDSDSSSINN